MAYKEGDLPSYWQSGLGAIDYVAITPNDSADIPNGPVRALWIGGAGNVAVKGASGTTVNFLGCGSGTIVPITCARVMSTNTTATGIVGLI
jgi:hypothetical protein